MFSCCKSDTLAILMVGKQHICVMQSFRPSLKRVFHQRSAATHAGQGECPDCLVFDDTRRTHSRSSLPKEDDGAFAPYSTARLAIPYGDSTFPKGMAADSSPRQHRVSLSPCKGGERLTKTSRENGSHDALARGGNSTRAGNS